MPKLDPFQISSRLHDKLEDLRASKEVAARDLKALLSDERMAAMQQAWAEQQALRKKKRARTKEEEAALGWKSKREVQIETVEAELAMHADNALVYLEKEMYAAEVRGARIFLNSYFKAREEGKSAESARKYADNCLVRAGLNPTNRNRTKQGLTIRDIEVLAMEESLRKQFEAEMDDYEREQLELLRDTERAERTERTRRTKR